MTPEQEIEKYLLRLQFIVSGTAQIWSHYHLIEAHLQSGEVSEEFMEQMRQIGTRLHELLNKTRDYYIQANTQRSDEWKNEAYLSENIEQLQIIVKDLVELTDSARQRFMLAHPEVVEENAKYIRGLLDDVVDAVNTLALVELDSSESE